MNPSTKNDPKVCIYCLFFVLLQHELHYYTNMSTSLNIANTPIAPYIGLLNNMGREEKIALVLFLVDSLPGIDVVETAEKEDELQKDDAFLAEKLSRMTFSPRIERLFEKRKEAARMIDLNDERTRHILGL